MSSDHVIRLFNGAQTMRAYHHAKRLAARLTRTGQLAMVDSAIDARARLEAM